MNKDEFYLKVAHALSGCQLVEQELKLYITEALALAKECIGNKMPFRMSGEDYEDSSLEKLIHAFKKLSDNDNLVSRLNKFKDERNYLSHKGISHCLDWDERLFQSAAAQFQERLEAIQKESKKLREEIQWEGTKITVHLEFDDISEKD